MKGARVGNVPNPTTKRVFFECLGFKIYTCHLGKVGNFYMLRYIAQLPSGNSIRLHKIVRPDQDRAPHDHPFDTVSWAASPASTCTSPRT